MDFPVAARDLVEAARSGDVPVVDFREREVARALEVLDDGRSALVTGAEGAGKTAVVHGVAHALAARTGDQPAILELSTAVMISGTKYLGEWQTRIVQIAQSAEASKAILYVTDPWNLPRVGRWSGGDDNLLDALRPFIERRKVRLVAEASSDILQQMQRERGFVSLFTSVAVSALDERQVDEVVRRAADRAGVPADEASRRTLVDLTSRFSPSRPQPGPALALLRHVVDYQAQKRAAGEKAPVTPEFVDRVFSIYSGLPLFVVSRSETKPAREIRDWFRQRMVGQEAAIDAVVEAIALFKAGLHDPQRPVGTFLFVGPTGVGKTELARALSEFLFGTVTRLLRFDLSEFKDYNSIQTLIGDPDNPKSEARLVDPVRAQPFQVVLFDELEKAHQNVWDLLLPLLDEGRLTPPGGQAVSFRNTLLIATSNVGARDSWRSLGFGEATGGGDARAAGRIREELERVFRPELLNRFQHIAVFHALTRDQVRVIARQELKRVLRRDGITARNLVVDVSDEALDAVIDRGFDQKYGARALKRQVQSELVLPLAMTLMERRVDAGSILRVGVRDGAIRVTVHDTEDTRAARREAEPVALPEGQKLGRAELAARIEAAAAGGGELAGAVGEAALRDARARLDELRQMPTFWRDAAAGAAVVDELDRVASTLERVESLRARVDALAELAPRAQLRREVQDAAHRVLQVEEAIAVARRELVTMPRAGREDALIEIRPLAAAGRPARDLLVETYRAWALEARRYRVLWLREPVEDDEPAMLAIQGRFASGYLAGEAGLHRVRRGESHAAAEVRVAPWSERAAQVAFGPHRALKATGQFGGRIRSRVELADGFVLQNERTLADNRELAVEVAGSWRAAAAAPDDITRRYDFEPFLLRDALTETSTGRADALSPLRFHELLCRRVDVRRAG